MVFWGFLSALGLFLVSVCPVLACNSVDWESFHAFRATFGRTAPFGVLRWKRCNANFVFGILVSLYSPKCNVVSSAGIVFKMADAMVLFQKMNSEEVVQDSLLLKKLHKSNRLQHVPPSVVYNILKY